MADKSSENVKSHDEIWPSSNSAAAIMCMVIPAAFLTLLLSHSSVFLDFLLNFEYIKHKVLYPTDRRRERLSDWLQETIPMPSRYKNCLNEIDIWRDGSILCSLVNTVVSGACLNPQSHYGQRPAHGQEMVFKYLGIKPVFSDDELNGELNSQKKNKLIQYLLSIHQTITNLSKSSTNMKLSTDYVAKGMGLVVGQQHRRSVFYIYPIPKKYHEASDIDVTINGPFRTYGQMTIPSIYHCEKRYQNPTDYSRALYLSSKANSISPTTQGSSFLRRLSLYSSRKIPKSGEEIPIRVRVSNSRAKITYVPIKIGIYEVNLVTKGSHIFGSPFTVPVEILPTGANYDSDSQSEEETDDRIVQRKKKVITRIVDFVDEKMLLQNDGTLSKIDETQSKPNAETISLKKKADEIQKKESIQVKNEDKKVRDFINSIENASGKVNNLQKSCVNYELTTREVKIENSKGTYKRMKQLQENYKENNLKKNNNFEACYKINGNANVQEHMKQTNEDINIQSDNYNLLNNEPDLKGDKILVSPGDEIYTINNNVTETPNKNLKQIEETSDKNNNKDDEIHKMALDLLENFNSQSPKLTSQEPNQSFLSNLPCSPNSENEPVSPCFEITSTTNIGKTFSTKDPSKEDTATTKEFVIYQCDNKSKSVNKLIKRFEFNANNKNDPDLVKCHTKKQIIPIFSEKEKQEILEQESINKISKDNGAISKEHNKKQCKLKHQLNKQMSETELSNTKNNFESIQGIVQQQKTFWQNKSNENIKNITEITDNEKKRPKKFIIIQSETENENVNEPNENIVKPPEEIVKNKSKLFENECSSEDKVQNKKAYVTENFAEKTNTKVINNLEQIGNVPSTSNSEEIIKYPSVEERKAQLLKAFSETSSLPFENKNENKKLKLSKSQKTNSSDACSESSIQDSELSNVPVKSKVKTTELEENISPNNIENEPNKQNVKTTELKPSTKRKARFKRAKQFFQTLEGSHVNIAANNNYSDSFTINPKVQRSESAPCLFRNIKYESKEFQDIGGSMRPMKISDRFQVNDLFRDILGDRKKFLGIPNKMAVVASLASLDSDSSKADFNSANEDEMEHFEKRPKKKTRRRNFAQGFHQEYPHPPMTDRWRYRPRSDTDLAGLIPRRILLSQSTNCLHI